MHTWQDTNSLFQFIYVLMLVHVDLTVAMVWCIGRTLLSCAGSADQLCYCPALTGGGCCSAPRTRVMAYEQCCSLLKHDHVVRSLTVSLHWLLLLLLLLALCTFPAGACTPPV